MADVVVMFKKSDLVPMVVRPDHIDKIKECISGEVYWCGSEKEALEKGIDGDVLFIWGGSGPQPAEYCRKSEKLKWINTFSAGVNAIMDSPISSLPIKLTNAKGIHGTTMGITTLGYMISFMRQFPEFQRRQQRHEWNKNVEPRLREAEGLTVTIVGAGAIGSGVAKFAKACDMRVIGVKRKVCELENFDEVYPDTEMEKAMGMGDFVVILTPLTDATRGLIDLEKIKAMKSTAVLINISRGPVVNTDDLVYALENKIIAGAALDAVDPEPLGADSPLWDMDNVIITPHCSADSEKYIDRAMDLFCENLIRYEKGQPLINEINLADKY